MERMHRMVYFILAILLAFVCAACERQGREYGGAKSSPLGAPEYKAKSVELASVRAESHIAEVSPNAGAAPDGAALYAANCVACHQMTGQGIPGVFPPLDGTRYVLSDNLERLSSIMLYGLMGPIKVKGVEYNGMMTPFSHLKDAELAAIATYVRSAWSNQASAVGEEIFAASRAKWGARGPFNITELGAED